jgi:hypothetical protein
MKLRAPKSIEAAVKRILPGTSRSARKIRRQIGTGHSPTLGFLHIPKTGGSGVNELGRKLVKQGEPFPCNFSHAWTVAEIRERYPRMRIALLLRDPLERTISAFNSRLRQGRPTYHRMWSPGEAVAFALFPDVTRYLDALLSDDEWSLSACAFAQKHVSHLRRNYRYYFRSPRKVGEQADAIALVGRIEDTDAFIEALLVEAGIPAARVAGLYRRRHEAPAPTASVLERYSPSDNAKLRARLGDEYRIYDALVGLAATGRTRAA